VPAGVMAMRRCLASRVAERIAVLVPLLAAPAIVAEVDVYLLDVPDYHWQYGCFGTACGNLAGFWDRTGFPGFYTGPTAGGVAPRDSWGANGGIRALWASESGIDGRPAHEPGHVDDYWVDYESTASDPYLTEHRVEHAPDCIGDFTGLSQKKWSNMNGECDGNIDAYSFNYWDKSGQRRLNYQPTGANGEPVPDLQSGLRAWTQHRGYSATVFTQLTDFNPTVAPGRGFTFEDLRQEIDAGYPVLLFLQQFTTYSRSLEGMPKANPELHGMLAYGYQITDAGQRIVRYRTSWGSGDNMFALWSPAKWESDLPLRGVIGYHPLPQITGLTLGPSTLEISWDGPVARLYNAVSRSTTQVHRYVVEMAPSPDPAGFSPVTEVLSERHAVIPREAGVDSAFFRVILVGP